VANHALLSPSAASRWRACPGSVALSQDIVREDTSYSKAGTAAHEAFSIWLATGTAPEIGRMTANGLPITAEMIDSLRPMVDWVLTYKTIESARLFSEERIEIGEHLGLPAGVCWGTADIMAISERELLIADLKTGYVSVDPECDQMILYAIGAWFQTGCIYDTIRLVVLQPPDETPVKEKVYNRVDMMKWVKDYSLILESASSEKAPLVPGDDQCRFCPAAGGCPALQEETLKLAKFEAIGNPLALSLDQMAVILDKADMIEKAIEAIRGHVVKLLASGQQVPGFKLVVGKKNRAWTSADTVLDDLLLADATVPLDKLAPRKLVSPAQAEKILSKDLVATLAFTPEGEPTLARADDKRPEYKAAEVFTQYLPSHEG